MAYSVIDRLRGQARYDAALECIRAHDNLKIAAKVRRSTRMDADRANTADRVWDLLKDTGPAGTEATS